MSGRPNQPFPYNHLRILGVTKVRPYVPPLPKLRPAAPYRTAEARDMTTAAPATIEQPRTPRALTIADVDVRLERREEEDSPDGHFDDPETVKWVRDQLDSGNEWAWFCARVVVEWNGFEGDDFLGACSYESMESFVNEEGGYYSSMIDEALARLNEKVRLAAEALAPLYEKA